MHTGNLRSHVMCGAAALIVLLPSLVGATHTFPVNRFAPSVVTVSTYGEEGQPIGKAGGFYLSASGKIVTSFEIFRDAARAEIVHGDGEVVSAASLDGEDPDHNLALIAAGRRKPGLSLTAYPPVPASLREKSITLGSCLIHGVEPMNGTIVEIRQLPFLGRYFKIDGCRPDLEGSLVISMQGDPIGVIIHSETEETGGFSIAVPVDHARRLLLAAGDGSDRVGNPPFSVEISPARDLYFSGLRRIWSSHYRNAFALFEEAVKANPGMAEGWFLLGYAADRLGLHHRAVEAYGQALRLRPEVAEGQYYLGNAYGRIKCYHDAAEAYEKALAVEPGDAIYFKLALAYSRLGWPAKAEETFRRAVCFRSLELGGPASSCSEGVLERFSELMAAYLERGWTDDEVAEEHFQKGLTYLMLTKMNLAMKEYETLRVLDRQQAAGFYKLLER